MIINSLFLMKYILHIFRLFLLFFYLFYLKIGVLSRLFELKLDFPSRSSIAPWIWITLFVIMVQQAEFFSSIYSFRESVDLFLFFSWYFVRLSNKIVWKAFLLIFFSRVFLPAFLSTSMSYCFEYFLNCIIVRKMHIVLIWIEMLTQF